LAQPENGKDQALRLGAFDSEAGRDALRRFEARFGDLLYGSASGLENFGWRRLGTAAVKGRIGGILDSELNLLRDSFAGQEHGYSQCPIESSRDAGGADVLAVDYYSSVDWNCSKIREQTKCGPVRGGSDSPQQARCAA
jgi:hypothetical protein